MTRLTRFAWLSVAAALLTIGLKSTAFLLTGSVGLLSDALESLVNLAAALMALAILDIAVRPPDQDHSYGHSKAEYFASGIEGALIILAAASIVWAAVGRLLAPQPIEHVGIGLLVSVIAALLNWGVARVLLRAGRDFHSITLEADARHLMTDVWTSAGVVVAVGAVALTGWQILDPLIAIAVAGNIVWSGLRLMLRAAHGLMDPALPTADQAAIQRVLEAYERQGLQFHALRTRQAGARNFASLHVLVPGAWSVQRGHELLERIEADLRAVVPRCSVLTHLEPQEDPCAWEDIDLDRPATPGAAATPS
ncbi:MAG: cation transporter [Chloroflexi bacterium]|nr:cation transporter [Chloroflexota bacterium]